MSGAPTNNSTDLSGLSTTLLTPTVVMVLSTYISPTISHLTTTDLSFSNITLSQQISNKVIYSNILTPEKTNIIDLMENYFSVPPGVGNADNTGLYVDLSNNFTVANVISCANKFSDKYIYSNMDLATTLSQTVSTFVDELSQSKNVIDNYLLDINPGSYGYYNEQAFTQVNLVDSCGNHYAADICGNLIEVNDFSNNVNIALTQFPTNGPLTMLLQFLLLPADASSKEDIPVWGDLNNLPAYQYFITIDSYLYDTSSNYPYYPYNTTTVNTGVSNAI
jgi:hypothetical protein